MKTVFDFLSHPPLHSIPRVRVRFVLEQIRCVSVAPLSLSRSRSGEGTTEVCTTKVAVAESNEFLFGSLRTSPTALTRSPMHVYLLDR